MTASTFSRPSGARRDSLILPALDDVEAVARLALVEDDAAAGQREHLQSTDDRLHRLVREPLEEPGLGQHLVHCTSSCNRSDGAHCGVRVRRESRRLCHRSPDRWARRPPTGRVGLPAGTRRELRRGQGGPSSDQRRVRRRPAAAAAARASGTARGGCRTTARVSTSPGVAVLRNSDDLAGRGRTAQRLLDPLHHQQEGDQQRREEDDAESDHATSSPSRRRGRTAVDDDTDRSLSAGPPTLDSVSATVPVERARLRAARSASAVPRRRPLTGASPFDPAETPLSRTRRARRMARELARDPPRRALRAGLHQRRSSCWSPRCCRRRPPTRWSTR